MSTYGTIKYTGFQDSGVVVGNTAYTNTVDLPTSNLEIGAVAFVSETSKMYMWTGSSWFNIAIANQAPTAISGNVASYDLARDGTTTTVTLTSTDPEGLPLTWSSSVSGVTQAATVTNVDNVFTITPSTNDAHAGTINVTFSVTDGNNTETSLSSFILRFLIPNSQYTSTLVEATGTGTNVTFVDASTQTHTITNTNVVAGTFSPYRSGGYSTYFDGSGDYVSVSNSGTTFTLDGDFTIEAWVYGAFPTGDNNGVTIIDTRGSLTASNWSFGVYGNLSGQGAAVNNGAGFLYDSAVRGTNIAVIPNQWNHVAISRSGTTIRMFVNGVQGFSETKSGTLTKGTSTTVKIGAGADGAAYGNTSYISNLRFVNGTAVYTSNFTPSTEPLTAITNTALLTCHLPYIADGSTNAHAITVTGTVSTKPLTPFDNVEYSEASHGSSGYFDGDGDYLQLPSDAGFSFGTGDFTVECWVYYPPISQTNGKALVDTRPITTNGAYWLFGTTNNGTMTFTTATSGGTLVTDTEARTNQWVHYAATRSGTNLRLFANGQLVASATDSTNIGSNVLKIGRNAYSGSAPDTWWLGYTSDLRIVKGTAVYTAAFTPPTAPLTAVTNTTFLLNPNPSIIDKAQKDGLFEFYGNVTGSDQQQLFSSSTMKFDGNGDYILLREGLPIPSGSSFTIEAWARPSSPPRPDRVMTSQHYLVLMLKTMVQMCCCTHPRE